MDKNISKKIAAELGIKEWQAVAAEQLIDEGNTVPFIARYRNGREKNGRHPDGDDLVFASGIPGSIGGAVYMNAGAYGKEISSILRDVTILDDKLNVKVLSREELNSSYRDSIFKHKDYVCLEATFELEHGDKNKILEEIKSIIETRKAKQPLEYPSAGSVFKNGEGYSAGRLIEKAGLKGTRVGDAEVSMKHANFIVNRGKAKAEDVINLIGIIKDKIKEEDNVDLVLEQEILK